MISFRYRSCVRLSALFKSREGIAFLFAVGAGAVLYAGAPEPAVIGSPAPAYSAFDLDGRSVNLADFLGQPVVLNVWATWCRPCREEMPSLARMQSDLEEEGLVVVAVSIDSAVGSGGVREFETRAVRRFLDAYGVDLRVWLDSERRVEKAFRTVGVPTTILIDRRGVVSNVVIGEVDWDDRFYRGMVEGLIEQVAPAERTVRSPVSSP